MGKAVLKKLNKLSRGSSKEDQFDLEAFWKRKNEPTVTYEELLDHLVKKRKLI